MDNLIKKNPELSQLVKTHNLEHKATNRKWLNAVFMKHMGKTIKEFETLAQYYLDQ
jgi:hypothetical protein